LTKKELAIGAAIVSCIISLAGVACIIFADNIGILFFNIPQSDTARIVEELTSSLHTADRTAGSLITVMSGLSLIICFYALKRMSNFHDEFSAFTIIVISISSVVFFIGTLSARLWASGRMSGNRRVQARNLILWSEGGLRIDAVERLAESVAWRFSWSGGLITIVGVLCFIVCCLVLYYEFCKDDKQFVDDYMVND